MHYPKCPLIQVYWILNEWTNVWVQTYDVFVNLFPCEQSTKIRRSFVFLHTLHWNKSSFQFLCCCRSTVRWKCGLSTGRNGVPHGSVQKSCVQHQQQWTGVCHELGHGTHGGSRWARLQNYHPIRTLIHWTTLIQIEKW